MTLARSNFHGQGAQSFAPPVRNDCRSSSGANGVELGKACREKLVNELGDAGATRARGDESSVLLHRRHGIRDRYRQPADIKKGKVIFGIADTDTIERRQTEPGQCVAQAARLGDAGRQHHDSAACWT